MGRGGVGAGGPSWQGRRRGSVPAAWVFPWGRLAVVGACGSCSGMRVCFQGGPEWETGGRQTDAVWAKASALIRGELVTKTATLGAWRGGGPQAVMMVARSALDVRTDWCVWVLMMVVLAVRCGGGGLGG